MSEKDILQEKTSASLQSSDESAQQEPQPMDSGSEAMASDQVSGSEAVAEQTEEELRKQLIVELDALIERMQAVRPEYAPPPFSPQGLVNLIEQNLTRLSPEWGLALLSRVRSSISEDLLDVDTWKGVWYMLNYSLQYQTDFVKRRISGEYETDEWGLDPEMIQIMTPFLTFMYRKYWRVQTSGMENVPDEGRALLVSNHSGQLPWDAAMVGTSIYLEHPSQRMVRALYATWFPTLPFVSAMLTKMGQVLANEENGYRLLQQEQLVAVFPEGIKGVGKLYRDRYKLVRFGRGGFVRMALRTGAPMIPVSVVGAEETYISLFKVPFIARLIGFPFFPISPTWPWFGLLGFVPIPTKWYIDFVEPIPTESYGPSAANNLVLVSQLTDQVRNIVQNMLLDRLAKRRSVIFG
jgi:1-acyl-sn-glycerol-3-phosphate acyltransferase